MYYVPSGTVYIIIFLWVPWDTLNLDLWNYTFTWHDCWVISDATLRTSGMDDMMSAAILCYADMDSGFIAVGVITMLIIMVLWLCGVVQARPWLKTASIMSLCCSWRLWFAIHSSNNTAAIVLSGKY